MKGLRGRLDALRVKHRLLTRVFVAVMAALSVLNYLQERGVLENGALDFRRWSTQLSDSLWNGSAYRVASLSWDGLRDGCDTVRSEFLPSSPAAFRPTIVPFLAQRSFGSCVGGVVWTKDIWGILIPGPLLFRTIAAIVTALTVLYIQGGIAGLVLQLIVLAVSAFAIYAWLFEDKEPDLYGFTIIALGSIALSFVVGSLLCALLALLTGVVWGMLLAISAVATALAAAGVLSVADSVHTAHAGYESISESVAIAREAETK